MVDLSTLSDEAVVTVTVRADVASTPVKVTVNGVTKEIPNNIPTPIPVAYARALDDSMGYHFEISEGQQDASPSLGGGDAGDGAQPAGATVPDSPRTVQEGSGTPALDAPNDDSTALGPDLVHAEMNEGTGTSEEVEQVEQVAQDIQQSDASSEQTDEPAKFDATPIIDGNTNTVLARIEGLNPEQLKAVRAAEKKGKDRKGVLEAIDAKLA